MERESMKEELLIQSSSSMVDEEAFIMDDDSSSCVTALSVISSLVAIVGSFTYGFATAFSSPAESGIMEELGLSIAEYSFFGSTMIIGSMVGALLCGKVTDLIGRKGTMWSSEIFCILGWLAIAFGKGAWLLDIGRLSLGFGVGLHCYVAPVYIGEITPTSIRGACTVANQLVVTCGLSLMYFIGNIITWRTLALIGIIPCLIKLVGLFFIPESPRWLEKIGQEKKFEATLQRLRGKNADISVEVAEIKAYMKDLQALPNSRFIDLFEKKHTRSLMIVVGLTTLVQFGGAYGIASYASSIFEAAGCPPIIGTTALAIIQIFFSSLGVILTDKCGRRPVWMISAAGTCLGNFLVGFAFLLQDLHQMKMLTAVLVPCGILIFSSSFSVGMSGTQWIIMSEILPIRVKGAAGSLVTFVNWSSSWIITYSFNFAFAWSSTGTFFFFAIMSGSIVVFVAKLLPETRGRTLEEIQARI